MLKNVILEALFALPIGFFLGIFSFYIIRKFFGVEKIRIWHSLLGLWAVVVVLQFVFPHFLQTQIFQGVFSVVVIWGLVSIFQSKKKQGVKSNA